MDLIFEPAETWLFAYVGICELYSQFYNKVSPLCSHYHL
jgi:hypothetical protein